MKQSLHNVSSYTQGLKWDLTQFGVAKQQRETKNVNNNCNA